MENWKIYREDEIPKDVYIGDISYVEDNNPVIKLENWHNGRIINYIKLEFKNMYSVRVFEEGRALNKILEDKNGRIKNKGEISTIRVLDLNLTKHNKEFISDTQRIVHIKLLENEKSKDILVYHIKEDNSLELIKSTVSNGILTYTINHFSKFVIIGKTKISHQIDSTDKDNDKKFSVLDNKGAKSNSKNNILPKTGITSGSNVSLGLILILIISALLRFKKALK